MSPTLFSLPLEIRDHIYTYLWADVRSVCVHTDQNMTLRAELPYYGSEGAYPRWLYSSQAILKEGIELFQRICSFHLEFHNASWYASSAFDSQMFWPCSPLQIRTLRIDHRYSLIDLQDYPINSSAPPRRPYELLVTSLNYIDEFLHEIATIGKLQILKLYVRPHPEHYDRNQDILRLREAFEDILPQLHRFELHVTASQLILYGGIRARMGNARDTARDAACNKIEASATAKVDRLDTMGMGGLTRVSKGDVEAARITSSWRDIEEVIGWRFTWVKSESSEKLMEG
jgi:hypothetical protein